MEDPGSRPRVAVYREVFLPPSETFVRDHLLTLQRYRPVALTTRVVEGGLEVPGVELRVSEPAGMAARLERRLSRHLHVPAHVQRSRSLVGSVRRLQPAVLHAHFGVDGAVVRRAAVSTGTPFVVTFHGYDASIRPEVLEAAGGASAYMVKTWERLLGAAGAVVTVSAALRATLLARGADPDKVHVIPCGVRTRDLEASPVPPGGPLLFVGRLVEKKGLADLLQALAGLPNAPRLRVVGDGPLRPSLEALAADLRLDVSFEGTASTPEVLEAIRTSRLVLMPSRTAADGDTEGLPVVSLEASALGRPVVGYRHSGLVESVLDGETGVLVPEGDVEALRAAISRLLADQRTVDRLGAAARTHVEEHFDLEDCVRRLEDVYDLVRR